MGEMGTILHEFANVAFEKQTYMNLLYLLFSFPLGTAYFAFLVTGLSLGFSLLLMWIGLPLLIIVFLAWWEIASFERQMAIWLLGIDIPELYLAPSDKKNIIERISFRLKNPVTWKSLLFLLLKFPIGIISLTIMLFLVALSLGMLIDPLLYVIGTGSADSLLESIMISIAGTFVGLGSMHLLNLLAYLEANFAKKMLGSEQIVHKEVHFIADAQF
ncbi:sensor domain-containing protein [Methanolobus sp.]|jgi:hypothetical protein|uniref:sensor domain-containing protein n=1 Tax=Methanolobus sp. TaxID=1874737 RepID=UPI0025E9E82E|nr:sensor domain-containing protein [Methanolobus sp.]